MNQQIITSQKKKYCLAQLLMNSVIQSGSCSWSSAKNWPTQQPATHGNLLVAPTSAASPASAFAFTLLMCISPESQAANNVPASHEFSSLQLQAEF
jgi:hypothetical protein